MKITGAEWKEFEKTGWPAGYVWADDSTLEDGRDLYVVDGAEGELIVRDDEVFVVPSYWSVTYEGPEGSGTDGNEGKRIRKLVQQWRKSRESVTFVITVPRADENVARQLIAERKWAVA